MLSLNARLKVLFAVSIMLSSIFWIFLLSLKLKNLLQSESLLSKNETIGFPTTIDELKSFSALLKAVYSKNSRFIFIFFSSVYLCKQIFAIPGASILNLLAGSIFGLYDGIIICSSLSTLGALGCFFLTKYCLKEIVEYYLTRTIADVQEAINNQGRSIFFYLLSARLFPATPNMILNIASPIIGVPWYWFASSCFIGLIPCITLCVKTGEVLNEITSMNDVYTTSNFLKITFFALLSLVPTFFSKCLKKKLPEKTEQPAVKKEK